MRLIALAVAIMLTSPPRRADACSCGNVPPDVAPADGAVGVPVNALLIAQHMWAYEPTLSLRNEATNEPVPITIELHRSSASLYGTTVFGYPLAPLEPNTTHVLATSVNGDYETTARFTTGDTTDMAPPAFEGLSGIALETMEYPIPDADGSTCISTCVGAGEDGRIARIHLDYPELPTDVVHVVFELVDPAGERIEEIPLSSSSPRYLGYGLCYPLAPDLVPGVEYCGRVIAYDAAGNRAGVAAVACGVAQDCEPRGGGTVGPSPNCEPSNECRPRVHVSHDGGCASTRSSSYSLVVLLALMRRRRRPQRS